MNSINLKSLFLPKSIAVIGASERNFYSANAILRLREIGFAGRVYLVNPNQNYIFGEHCFRSMSEIPEPIEAALIAVGREQVMSLLADCEHKGVKAAVILASGFAEKGNEKGKQLQHALRRFAETSRMAICGPNCLGVINVHDRFASFGGHQGTPIIPGNIGVVSQSGANLHCIMQAAFDRNLGFSYLISSGNEACLEAADYMDFMLDDDRTQLICGFIESFKDPKHFSKVAERALEKGKPLLIIKIGRSDKGSRLALTHTGALTGQERLYDGLFKQKGIIRAFSIDDLLDKCSLLAQLPHSKWPAGYELGVISISGGAACLTVDLAEDYRLEIPSLSSQFQQELGQLLPHDVTVQNPLELSGQVSRSREDLWIQCAEEFISQPNIHALVTILDVSERYESMLLGLAQVVRRTTKPVILSSVTARTLLEQTRQLLSFHCLPLVLGIEPCLKALKTVIDYEHFRKIHSEDHVSTNETPSAPILYPTKKWAMGTNVIDEYETKELLSSYGMVTAREKLGKSLEEVVKVADDIGYPVALKVVSSRITHKTEAKALALNIMNCIELERAYDQIVESAIASYPDAEIKGVLVQEMVDGIAEMYIGVSFNNELGPLVLLGLGGTFVELLDDVSARIAPLGRREAEAMIRELKGYRVLTGFRNKPRADVPALADALVTISRLAMDLEDKFSELDINPVMVLKEGYGTKVIDAALTLRQE